MIQPSFGYLGHIHYKKSRVGLKQSFQSTKIVGKKS